ncbi:MAG: homoserine O-acetyltransferase [Fibrobacterota bacterium]|nr:homoserine O-acetyltransferase [Fibrobacterota bacterium]QQS04071.1 MAG: homoserine O-acetyltransferase [Fibrobacterota bacterium]
MGIADSSWISEKTYDWARSVGVVETRTIKLDLGPDGFVCQDGAALSELEVAFETYGALDATGSNAVLVTTPLTADCHVAGFHGDRSAMKTKGWWDEMVGPGKAIDTRRFFVVCASMLGGSAGTSGPRSIDPRTQAPYGSSFPSIGIGDMVQVQKLLLDALGVRKLFAVVGGSMGGMQALEWSLRHPEFVERCACVAAAPSLSAQALAFDIVGRQAILDDPVWSHGRYRIDAPPARGLSLARKIAHITYLSAEGMAGKFGRRLRENDLPDRFRTAFEVEKYLEHQGSKFVDRFDANAYLYITHAMDRFDLASAYGDTDSDAEGSLPRLVSAFSRARCRFLVVALSSDWLFPAAESWRVAEALVEAGKEVSYCQLTSPHGHDGFLLEVDQLDQVLTSFLGVDHRRPDTPPAANSVVSGLATRSSDQDVILSMIHSGSRVLDIGCGDGSLLERLIVERGCQGKGLDLDLDAVIRAMGKGLSALHGDAVQALRQMPDGAWDHVVLNQTLQAVANPPEVLREILRVGKEAIVGFPNFAVWRCRMAVLLHGRMPKTADLPFEWYETPNLHPFTLEDFEEYCRRERIEIREIRPISDHALGRVLVRTGCANLGADRVIARIARLS